MAGAELPPSGPPLPPPDAPLVIPPRWHPDPSPWRLRRWAAASWLRARFWGAVFAVFSDGVTTRHADGTLVPLFRRNHLPAGPLVVVSNHTSHADSAALVTTLGRDHRPVLFAAAADYWLTDWAYTVAGSSLIGLWPTRRGPEGAHDLHAAIPALRKGTVIIVYPEGTRGAGGELGTFKHGAFDLAADAGATILTVAVKGTSELLPKHGRIHRRPVEVRWGAAIAPDQLAGSDSRQVAEQARTAVAELLSPPVPTLPGFGYAHVARIAASTLGLAIVFFWAFGEGVSWPLIAEMPLLLLVVTVGLSWRGPLLIAASALGSILGIVTTWWLVTHGIDPPTPWTTPRMHATALAQLTDDPSTAFWHQMFNGIPVKVYAHASGTLHLPFATLIQVVLPRALRIVIIGGSAWLLSSVLARYLRPCLGAIQFWSLVAFPFALAAVVGYWA